MELVVRFLPLSVSLSRAAAEATLRRAEQCINATVVISNMFSERLSATIGDGRNPLKQNIFCQVFR